MKYRQNLHTHTVFSDGKDTSEQIILKAIELGFSSIGFSDHSMMPFEVTGAMTKQSSEESKRQIEDLKQKYKGIISVYNGLEFDLFSPQDVGDYDFVIGSCHCLELDGEIIEFDGNKTHVKGVIERLFGGNGLKYAQTYYQTLARLSSVERVDIVGHFDLVTKHSETESFFDTESKEYQNFALEALCSLYERCKVFEINTGVVSRGYKTTFYPAPFIMRELKSRGAKMIISSDCHDKNLLDFGFSDALDYLKSFGFEAVFTFDGNGFIPQKI